MAKGTVVMMLLFVSVVYEKTAVPFETTVGRPLVPLPSIPMAESLMDEGGLLLNPCTLPRQSLVGDRVLADFFLAILFRAFSPALG